MTWAGAKVIMSGAAPGPVSTLISGDANAEIRDVADLDPDDLGREPRIIDRERREQVSTKAMQGEATISVTRRRRRPGSQFFERMRQEVRPLGLAVNRTEDRPDVDHDALDGPALHIEQASLDHLLGLKPDVAGGLLGVEIELAPADSIPRRDRRDAKAFMT